MGGNLELTGAGLQGSMGRAALVGSTTRYGEGAFEVVARRKPGVVRKRAIKLVVLGSPFLETTPLALGKSTEPIGGMPGGRTGRLGVEVVGEGGVVLGAGGGRSAVDAGYAFSLRTGCGGVTLTSYTRSPLGLTR